MGVTMINKHELLFVVDKDNNPLVPRPRNEVHTKGYWHRTSHIWIYNDALQILCQKRSLLKDLNPGMWEAFFGGHMEPDESFLSNARRELKEELGISAKAEDFHLYKVFKHPHGKEFQGIYYLKWNGDIATLKFEKEEIDEVQWKQIEEVYEKLIKLKDAHWSIMGYEKVLLDMLKTKGE